MCRVAVHALLFTLGVAARNHGNDVIFTNEPCDAFSQGTKFRPVDGDSTRYKQCGPVGYFWILPCASGTLFSIAHRACVPPDATPPPPTTAEPMTITTSITSPPIFPTASGSLSTTTSAPDLVVFPLQNITNVPSNGASIVDNFPGLSPRLVSEFEGAMVDFMMKKGQLASAAALSTTTQQTPTTDGSDQMLMPAATLTNGYQQSTPSPTEKTIANFYTTVRQTLLPFVVEPLLASSATTTESPTLKIKDIGSSSTIAEYGFAIVDDRSPRIDSPASSFLPGLMPAAPQPAIEEYFFTTDLPPLSTPASNEAKGETLLVAPLDDRPRFPLMTTTAAPMTKVRLFRGCEIGASCPFGSEANELFCYHPTDSHGYLHCTPGSDKQGEWVERFCPDTLVFMGDRCENALTSTDLQTLPPHIHQVTMPPFTVSAPPYQWQPEAPRSTRPPTIAPQAANGWTVHPPLLPAATSKRPLFPRVHPFDPPPGVMPRVRPPPPPPPPQLPPELARPLPPSPVATLPRTIDPAIASVENELLHKIDALRSLQVVGGGEGGQPPQGQQPMGPSVTREQVELAQRELIEKFRAVEQLESQGRMFPGFPPSDFHALPPPVATFSQDLEPLARRIAEYLAAQHPSTLAALMQSPGSVSAALQTGGAWAKELPGYLPKLADAALSGFARMKMAPLSDDTLIESADFSTDPTVNGACSQLQQLAADSKEPSAFFMCVATPTNSDQAGNEKKGGGRWIRMLCSVGQVYKPADSVCE
uniref:Chitin-binding type-2 domain-containing protein n=1 Tax=Plectus sambesii TaxID=2011161 RepID=A0A914UMU2_9BILA